ncbi:MAG TPA: PQQ-like beta-propeller repeat protein [Prolixibacteraceae bacterium]|nr:PQQ-like beta-propeller repeat protein [Prolixibacteraceae bacterium]
MSRIALFIAILFLSISCNKQNVQVYEWRGPNRSGNYSEENNLLKQWPDNGLKILWETEILGNGYGSPIISSDKLLVIGTIDSTAFLFAFDHSGNELFKTAIGNEWAINFPGSRGTPTVAGNMCYTITGKGMLTAVNTETGNLVWQKNFIVDFNGEVPRFGYAESPIVSDNMLICVPGGPENNVVALDRMTGELVWSCKGKAERSAYNSAALFEMGDKKIIAAFSAYHLMAIDAKNGQLLWVHEQTNTPVEKREPGTGDTHGNTVIFENPMLYYVEGEGNCAVALQIATDGLSYKQIWTNKDVNNYMGGIVLIDNTIYSCAFSKNTLVAINANNGEIVSSEKLGRGALIAADSMLYYYNQRGEVHLIDYSNKQLNSISNFKITKGSNEHFAHPVINNKVLYIRHGNYFGAFDIGTQAPFEL